jgi:hypothetical protein
MSTHNALPAGAAARPRFPVRSRAAAPIDSIARLTRLSDRLDALLRARTIGARSQREHDGHVAEAEAIAAGLRAVFREPTPARPANPPLKVGPGEAWY